MGTKDKTYQIYYILSNGKTIVNGDKRAKVMQEWEIVSELSPEEIIKYLKLNKGKNKGKYDGVEVVEIKIIDWVGVKLANKVFEKEGDD